MIIRQSGNAWSIRFIEFVGLPGSGKSTVAACLTADLIRHGIRAISRSAVLADDSPFIWRQFKRVLIVIRNAGECWHLYRTALKLILASGQKSVKDAAKVTWNFWSVIALMANSRRSAGQVTIVDQGLLQAIWSVQLSASKALTIDLWKDLLLAAGINDILLVNIRSGMETARRRVATRQSTGTRLAPTADSGSDSDWNAASAGMAGLLDLAGGLFPRGVSGSRIITIENDVEPPEIAAMQVASIFLARGDDDRLSV